MAAKALIQRMFACGLTKLSDFESFHPERLHDAISRDGFLQYLAQIGEARTAFLRRPADFPAELAYRPDDERDQDRRTQSHAPIDDHQDGNKSDESEYLTEPFSEPVRKGVANLFDIGNDGGHHAANGIVLKEADRLLHDLAVDLIYR